LFFFWLSLFSFCDVPLHYQITIQDPATKTLEWMIDLYDLIFFDLIVVVSIVFVLLISILFSSSHLDNEERYSSKAFSHSTALEVFWTIVPALLLVSIAYPSFNLLYALDEDFDFIETVYKIIGHQWYWTYEYHYSRYDIQFDSYMIDSANITNPKDFDFDLDYFRTYTKKRFVRLLDVDNRLGIFAGTNSVLLITSADVLHSWTIPSFGIKVDACPGRLTKTTLFVKRPGIYYGQCSEICGINHGFMPIVLEAHPYSSYSISIHRDIQFSDTNNTHFQKVTYFYQRRYADKVALIEGGKLLQVYYGPNKKLPDFILMSPMFFYDSKYDPNSPDYVKPPGPTILERLKQKIRESEDALLAEVDKNPTFKQPDYIQESVNEIRAARAKEHEEFLLQQEQDALRKAKEYEENLVKQKIAKEQKILIVKQEIEILNKAKNLILQLK